MSTADSIAFYLLKELGRAVQEFDLLAPGERVAVGVSGGKDSRALLELLLRWQQHAQEQGGRFELLAVHVDGSAVGLPDFRPLLEPWFQALGVSYEIVPLLLKPDDSRPPTCFRCSFNRRKALFLAADRSGCTKVAFGHHADDAAATALLNLLTTGNLETLWPRRAFFGGRLTVIRPLIYLTEAELARYARARGWETPAGLECPRGQESRRAQVVRFLRSLGRDQTQARANLWRAARTAMGF